MGRAINKKICHSGVKITFLQGADAMEISGCAVP